jgi:4-amino-4-deoxy-L-arabinose transferase-like glycosyltransferase
MLYIRLFYPIWQQLSQWTGFSYFSLLLWILPLLIFNSGSSSLMAHDEGLYAWRAKMMFDSGDWVSPWSQPHHKTPGIYWIIAISYKIFGVSEASVRLPSMIFGIFSVLILDEIGKIILGKKVAWLASAIFSVELLWLQYCRLGNPDVPMICLVLLAILCLLKAELHPKYSHILHFIVGLSFGLGFLIRSFMIFLPMMALLPYLIFEHRRHDHLKNPLLYIGFVFGLVPTCIWIWLNFIRYGDAGYAELFKFVFRLGSSERDGNGIMFYFWNIPLKAFPWSLFSILGLVLTIRHPKTNYQSILVGFPLILFAELSLFQTRLSHYGLVLYPFIALLAAVGLNWLGEHYFTRNKPLARNLSYAFGGFGILLLLASIVILIVSDTKSWKYAILGLAIGNACLILPTVWIARYRFAKKFVCVRYWLAGWLIPAWLGLAVAGSLGLIGDYNPDVKNFVQHNASIFQSYPVNLVEVHDKIEVLLDFYTPHHGKRVEEASQLPTNSFSWISVKQASQLTRPHRIIGTVQDYQLIQIF